MLVIIVVIILMFIVLIGWTWTNLSTIEKKHKVIFIVISILITFIITLIVFNISRAGIEYKNEKIISEVKNVLVTLFTSVNGLIIVQYIARLFGKIHNNEIDKEIATKKLVLMLVIFLICLVIECFYLKDIQKGILYMYNLNAKN